MIGPFPFGFSPFKKPYIPYFPKTNRDTKYDVQENFKKASVDDKILNNSCDVDNDCFDFFGIKLHSDDLLIICLLFFLYQEDVKDTYLYVALILLLLS